MTENDCNFPQLFTSSTLQPSSFMKRLLPLFFLFACSSADNTDALLQSITEESLMQHIEVLSDDSYMGRGPATPGEEMTVDYLIQHFENMGLKPAFGGSYIQDVPVVSYRSVRDKTNMKFTTPKGELDMTFATDYVVTPANNEVQNTLQGAELVFVGYGIIAPEENWDDYKGVDMTDKIIVIKNSDPYQDSTRFGGSARLYYGRWDYKFEMAKKVGAKGVLIIHTLGTAGYPWSVVANSWGGGQFRLAGNDVESTSIMQGWITSDIATKIFTDAGLDLSSLMEAAESPDFQPVPLNGVKLDLDLHAEFNDMTVKNVGGIIEGTDLKDEYVVFTAHHDHLGVGTPVDGDSIYNGALDNASGTSAFLNMARVFSEMNQKTRRSLLFLAVGAEEKGLLGAKYYAANPSVPPAKMAANINTDGLNVFGKTTDITYVGLGRSDIDDLLLPLAESMGRTVKPDQQPEQGFFYRSDHFAFARIGVPAFYGGMGRDFVGKPEGFATEVVENYNRMKYHTVFDQVGADWDLSGAVEDVRLYVRLAQAIANADQKRMWRAGDEFEAARLESLK
jgi:Zn-dependent M28 family amino/carboxypeptidase